MLSRIGFLCLVASLFGMVPTTQAQGKLPDLIPVVVNASQGSVEVRNIGGGVAKASRVFVVCSMFHSGQRSTPCAAGLHLPGYIAKWNTLAFDVPALQPGGKYLLHLFGSGALPRRPNIYGMKITTDPRKRIVEANESNNYTRLDTVIRMKASSGSKNMGKAADLVPVIINPDQGIVQVRNQGTATAKASRLAASCKILNSQGVFERYCTARTYLPNFDANRLLLNYSIPALRPGESHEIHLFGPGAWPRRSGMHHLEVHVDFDKQVAETSEGNNSTSFTSRYAAYKPVPGSKPQAKMPDLIAVASDPFYGIVYVENHGDSAAGASKLLMTCTQNGQNGGCATNPAMERLYNPELGGFVMNVPPLPAGKVHRVLFPTQNLNWDKGSYVFSLTADVTRMVAEASEKNNIVHRTLRWDTGVLRIVALNNGKPAPINYHIDPSGDRSSVPFYAAKKSGLGMQTPVDISLPTGVYQLGIQPANSHAVERRFNVEIKAGKVVAQKITFQQPGSLKIVIQDDRGNHLSSFSYFIRKHGEKRKYGGIIASGNEQSSPLEVGLPPGRYDLQVIQYRWFMNPMYHAVRDIQRTLKNRILGDNLQGDIADIQIQLKQQVEEKIIFKRADPGKLNIHVLADGKPRRAHINIHSQKDFQAVLSGGLAWFVSPARLKLAPGNYKLSVDPEDKNGGAFQKAGYGSRNVDITVHAGETLDRTVTFTSRQKGMLKLTALVNGSRSKAEISLRKAGSHAKFPYSSNVRASYNMISNTAKLLPGRYDVSVRPLESCFSPGGVDVFHGGVTGPGVRFRRVKGVEPVVLHGITIKSGEALKKTVKFKNDNHHAKVCL